MQTPPDRRASPPLGARLALPVAVLVGAVAVVALAASQRSASAGVPSGARLLSAMIVDAGLLFIALYCLAAAAILLLSLPAWKRGKRSPDAPELTPPSLGARHRDLLLLLVPPLIMGGAIALLATHAPNLGAVAPALGPGIAGAPPPTGGAVGAPPPSSGAASSPLLLRPTLFIAFAAFVIAAVSMVAWLLNGSGQRARARRRSGPWGLLVALLLAALAATLNTRRKPGSGAGAIPGNLPGGAAPPLPSAPFAPHLAPAAAGSEDWLALLIVLALLLIVAVVVVLRYRARRAPPLVAADAATEAFAAALDSGLDELRREADPRRAVIRAYAALEYALAAHGLPRRVSEAPFEYLARAWQRDDAAEAGQRLTLLFERARFGRQPITAAMQADAIDDLEHLRALLDEPEAEAAVGRAF